LEKKYIGSIKSAIVRIKLILHVAAKIMQVYKSKTLGSERTVRLGLA
jgi:hypothetical protein